MIRKFNIFLRTNKRFQWRLFVLAGIIVTLAFEGRTARFQVNKLSELKKEQQLVMKIDEMKRNLYINSLMNSWEGRPAVERDESGLVLKGTSNLQNGHSYAVALIDGKVYSEGDKVGDYIITKINPGEAVLKNKGTNEIKKLVLPRMLE